MNIIIYNYDDASTEELSAFSNKVDSSIYFALSFAEVTKLLKTKMMKIAILKILKNTETESLETMIKENPETEFYISMKNNLRKFNKHKIHVEALNTPLTTIAKQIILN
jgi:hypothetical protein